MSTTWKPVDIVVYGNPVDIDGINPWEHKWRRSSQDRIRLPHPAYPNQIHDFEIYEIEADGKKVIFAADELSNGVWGFYVPD